MFTLTEKSLYIFRLPRIEFMAEDLMRWITFFSMTFLAVATAVARPNFLLITVDDMSCDSVGVYGCALPETTPHMDAIAASGLRFQHAHVVVGNCKPSRNVMWSGR